MKNRYQKIIERVFFSHYVEGGEEFLFEREELIGIASELGIALPKNLGDIIYSFRYRSNLPDSIKSTTPEGKSWIIRPAGRGRYCFAAVVPLDIVPNPALSESKIPNATPGLVEMYALSDEQALLAIVRYNRLVDILTGIACYSLQNHLRTHVRGMGQVETDEIYVGVDKRGAHYVFPVQAKGGTDKLNIIQIEQDFAVCAEKFPNLICYAVASQFMRDNLIALFMFESGENGVALIDEKHYRLVPPKEISQEDLLTYSSRLPISR
ncbi:MAG: endonuclease [Syntrophobacteraceae bacterium]